MRIQTKASVAITAKTPSILDSGMVRHVTGGVTIDSALVALDGANMKVLPVGTVLAKVTATGKFAQYVSGQTDGRQNPLYVLYPDPADVTDGDGAFGAIDFGRLVKARMPVVPDATTITALKGIVFAD